MTVTFERLSGVRSEVQKIRLLSRRILASSEQGEYRSAFHGSGLLFSELRDYHPGDDIKHIAWKPTARTGRVLVKSYQEERQHNVLIALDMSTSMSVGADKSSLSVAAFHAATLTHLALVNRDKAGLVTFSDSLQTTILPSQKRSQLFHVIKTLIEESEQTRPTTDLNSSLNALHQLKLRPSVIFLISDFFATAYSSSLQLLSSRHDVICVLIQSPLLFALPEAGIVEYADAETDQRFCIDTKSLRGGNTFQRALESHRRDVERICRKSGADFIEAAHDIITPLRNLMKRRSTRVTAV
jgi:uncharacterized protein (DUF58 family)